MLYFIALFFLTVSATFAAVIPRDSSSAANSYSGNSGPANGGNSTNEGLEVISLFSNNGGDGGFTPTGASSAQSGGSGTTREDRTETERQRTLKSNPGFVGLFKEVPNSDC
ncbi:hypothetical protein EDD18DRAFT_11114 [Armillaria luteobubalina]|uniref:Secreted protein n=1 Tax=Armillaria luteobubalina TaxID=153913 RepID=A0AA39QP64_9AGAR|nr:hypothetical protein EDD18DRAFT_11114 [Armillaria luteobubalina]